MLAESFKSFFLFAPSSSCHSRRTVNEQITNVNLVDMRTGTYHHVWHRGLS